MNCAETMQELSALRALRDAVGSYALVQRQGQVVEVRIDAQDLGSAARSIAGTASRFADLFVSVQDGELILRMIYALDSEAAYLIVSSLVEDGQYTLLPDTVPAAFVEECETFEKFGILPRGSEPLNRVIMPPYAEASFPLSGGRRQRPQRSARARHFVRGEAFEFPFGPVRVAGWESLYMGLVTTGEEVLDLYLFHWHKHRGIERRLNWFEPQRALFFVERAEGLSAVGNGLAFCRAVETIAGVEPPPEAAYARAVALELERLYNHAAAIAMLCQTTGLGVGQAQAEITLEKLLRLNLAAFGHRYLFGVLALGGVSRAPDREAIRAQLPAICREFDRTIEVLLKTNSHVDRLEATGIVNRETARRLALVGPVARASGCDLDGRRDHSFAPYLDQKPAVAVRETGDAFARMQVFTEEIRESERMILTLLAKSGEGRTKFDPVAGSALGWAESPRGESLVWVTLNANGQITQTRLRPASARNWRAFDDAVRAQNVFTDVPIIEASFGLTVAGFAR